MILHLALALSMLAPPSSVPRQPSKAAAQKAFNDGEWETALDLYLELAKVPGAHPPHVLIGAHDSLRALHRAEPTETRHLCRALELAREVLRRDDLSVDDRAYWLGLEADDAQLAATSCEPTPNETSQPPPTEPPPEPSPSEQTPASETRDAAAAAPEGPAVAPAAEVKPRRSIARISSGSVLSAVGTGLLAGMVGALVRRRQADSEIASMTANVLAEQRSPTAAEEEAVDAANASFKRLGTTAWVLGSVGTVSLLTGLVVLLAPARAPSLARLRPKAGGLVYFF